MNIVFFGSPANALPYLQALLDAGHKIPLIFTQPDRPSGRGKETTASPVKRFADELGIPTCQPRRIRKDEEALERLKTAAPDLNVVAAYGQIMPDSVIFLPRYNSLNIHYSLLPRYRGASPVQWALLNGEVKTGVTLFEVNAGMDEGDIYDMEATPILPHENADELEKRLTVIGTRLLIRTIASIDSIKPRPQNHDEATYAPLIKKEDGRIDWNRSAERIANQIRAFTPWPSSFCFYKKTRLKIIKGRVVPAKGEGDPGVITAVSREGLEIACGGNTRFLIETIQPEGKKAMDARAYTLGARLLPCQLLH